jgi:hypothetical protein
LHGGRSAVVRLRPVTLSEPLASARRISTGVATLSSHQLLNWNENVEVAAVDTTGPSAPTGRWLVSRTFPDGSLTATTGDVVSWHEPLPDALTVMSAPRLPAAPPSGPDVATMSAGVQAATAEVPAGVADGLPVAAGGALLVTGDAVGLD